jgi:hypothetical protein
VYDLVTQQMIAQDLERSVSGFAVDDTTEEVVSPRSHIDTYATVKYDAQGNVLKRLEGVSGLALLDARRDRVYLVQWDDQHYLTVLDRDLNFLGTVGFSQLLAPQAALIDPEHDRVLVLQRDGQLFVLEAQAEPVGSVMDAPVPDHTAVLAIWRSPVTERLFAIFAPDEYTGAYGAVFRSDDTAATWECIRLATRSLISSLPIRPSLQLWRQWVTQAMASGAAMMAGKVAAFITRPDNLA